MTEDELRTLCIEFVIDFNEIRPEQWDYSDDDDRDKIMALCKRMQAVGLREALHIADSTNCYTRNRFDLELFEEQCIAKAQEREK